MTEQDARECQRCGYSEANHRREAHPYDPRPAEQDAREALRERLAEALGAEMYQVLMESTADAWRLWEYLTPAAKDRYRADASRIVTDALLPAVEEYAAERAEVAEATLARVETILRSGSSYQLAQRIRAALDGSPAGSGGEEAGRGSDGRSGASGGPRSAATGSGGVSGRSEGGEGL